VDSVFRRLVTERRGEERWNIPQNHVTAKAKLRLGLELYTACETVRRYLVVIVVVIKSQSQGRDRGERNTYATLVVYRSPQPCPRQNGGDRLQQQHGDRPRRQTGMKELLRIPGKT
ncbi:hypothetical protein K0M31_020423, partial [Melipona bicolor]